MTTLGEDAATPRRAHWRRWWTYQRERFPLLAHGPLIAAFSFSAVGYSFLLRDGSGFPPARAFIVAFVLSLLFFLQLRIADEFKDFEEDSQFRPYRAVPRGLVTLRELGVVGILGACVQLGVALWLSPVLALVLVGVWVYLALMTREFFVREWITARPFTYMWTHMLIIPLVDLCATACDWVRAGAAYPDGLLWFLVVSFFNGVVIEMGRKIRAPEDEEVGVKPYSRIWGRRNAVLAWLVALVLTVLCAWRAAHNIGVGAPVVAVLAFLLGVALLLAWRFLSDPVSGRGKLLEHFSGLWTLIMYLSLGAVPLLVRVAG